MLRLAHSLAFIVAVGGFAGCASTPTVTRHVDATRFAQLDPAVTKPAQDAHDKALADLERDSAKARERVAKAEAATRGADPPVGDEQVKKARLERAQAELKWQNKLVDGLTWRRAVAEATFELAKATILARTGADLDLEGFREQNAQLRKGLSRMDRDALAARIRFEEADKRFNEAKARYAKTMTAAPTAAATPTATATP